MLKNTTMIFIHFGPYMLNLVAKVEKHIVWFYHILGVTMCINVHFMQNLNINLWVDVWAEISD